MLTQLSFGGLIILLIVLFYFRRSLSSVASKTDIIVTEQSENVALVSHLGTNKFRAKVAEEAEKLEATKSYDELSKLLVKRD